MLSCLVCAGVALAAPSRARACGGGDDDGEAATTFDPAVIDDPSEAAMFYRPSTTGVGDGRCEPCAVDEMKVDWQGFLGPRVTADDWKRVLLGAPLPAIDALILALQGQGKDTATKVPAAYEKSSVLAAGDAASREKLIAALYFVGFARRVEPFAAPPPYWGAPRPTPPGDPAALQANGEKAFARVKDSFLRQRYAFQLLRLRFYRDDWQGVQAFFDKQRRTLETPSQSLAWRARYYVAGAVKRGGDLARANLLLARVFAGAPTLASSAAFDFHPMEEADWKQTLALAQSKQERVALWQLVGLTQDAVTAIRKIVALDPRSKRIALLAVRELNEAESKDDRPALRALGTLAGQLAKAPATDRRWLYELIAGHVAALDGDVAAARPRLQKVIAARPGTLAEQQAWASLALALSKRRPDVATGEALADAVSRTGNDYSRSSVVLFAVRHRLGLAYQADKMCVEARLFGVDDCPAPWSDPRFVEAMIARVSSPKTAFEHFMVDGSGFQREGLQLELAALHFARDDLQTALRLVRGPTGADGGELLHTEPFAFRIRDCHSCDREAFAGAKWTEASLLARLVELRSLADRPGEAGAAAAFDLGNAYYNLTELGNASGLLQSTHTRLGPERAEAWFKRAYDKTNNRELKAKAAFLAAKSELGRRLAAPTGKQAGARQQIDPKDELPISTDWFPQLRNLSDTAYEREVLRECGHYRRWAQRH